MSTPFSKTLSAEEIGKRLAKAFQGWHESSRTHIGRTVFFAAATGSASEKKIADIIRQEGALKITDPYISDFIKDREHVQPVVIKVRGGTHFSAATVCQVEGYVNTLGLFPLFKHKLIFSTPMQVCCADPTSYICT